jgi:hypothetical protein
MGVGEDLANLAQVLANARLAMPAGEMKNPELVHQRGSG